jgi:hypothetical protein
LHALRPRVPGNLSSLLKTFDLGNRLIASNNHKLIFPSQYIHLLLVEIKHILVGQAEDEPLGIFEKFLYEAMDVGFESLEGNLMHC